MKIISSELYVKDNKVYHEGNKPKPKDIGAAPETHTHNYASATTPGGSAEHAIKATEDSLGQRIDTYIKGLSVSGRTITYTRGDGTTGTITTQDNNTDTKVTNTLNTTAKAYITGTTNSATNTGTQVFDTNVYLDTTAGMLTATTFKGALQGNAATATSATSATSATKLATARTINGTSFDGTGNITTTNWGTARNIQIGNSSKSVNGSSNMTWTLAEIGAAPEGHTHNYAPASHNHGLLHDNFGTTIADTTTDNGWSMINGSYNGFLLKSLRSNSKAPAWLQGNYSAGIAFGGADTKGVMSVAYSTPSIRFAGGNGSKPVWHFTVNGSSGKTYNMDSLAANTANTLATTRTINGTNFNGSANITTANWGTARTLTIGNTGKSVNGSGNVSWSIGEIGAAPAVHNHTSLTGITNLSFATDGTDSGSITTTVDGTNTYFDFNLSDDPTQNDMWRWRFTPSGGTLFNAMTLDAISTTEAKLTVTGEVQATRLKGTLTGNVTGNVTGTVSGNAGSATKLATARTINGTSFDGTGNITTANWGTARNIQIGNAVKSVNGSANVTWSLSEIGAAPASHTHANVVMNNCSNKDLNTIKTAGFYYGYTGMTNAPVQAIAVLEVLVYSPDWIVQRFTVINNGGRKYERHYYDGKTWSNWRTLYDSSNKPTPTDIGAAASNHTHNYLPLSGGTMTGAITVSGESRFHNGTYTDPWNGTSCAIKASGHVAVGGQIKATSTITAPTFAGALSGNATTASSLASARLIGKASFNGSANITLDAIAGRATIPSSADAHVNKYSKFARIDVSGGTYRCCSGTLHFVPSEGNSFFGELRYYFRTGSAISSVSMDLRWKNLSNTSYANRVFAVKVSDGVYDLYYQPLVSWDTMTVTNVNSVGASLITLTSNQAYVTSITAALTSSLYSHVSNATAANTATKLQTARTINGTSFDGSANITTSLWGTSRNIYIADSDGTNTGSAVSVNGSANATLKLPATIKASLSGNASTATKLQTARTISLGGILSGSASFDGSGNVTINATANDITTITKSLKVTTSWMDTGITGTNLTTGTYAVQMLVNDGANTAHYNEYYSGIMSWYADGTNSTDADEILLHKAGHASNGRHVYLRTIRTGNSGRLKLQISCTHAFSAASNITFKFKKLI